MAERPIVFDAEMVCAVLNGTKTQTRLPLKEQPGPNNRIAHPQDKKCVINVRDDRLPAMGPFGAPGDELWVRERFGFHGSGWDSDMRGDEHRVTIRYHADDLKVELITSEENDIHQNKPQHWSSMDEFDQQLWLSNWWKRKKRIPARSMPRWASRIQLKVKRVWIEQVQDISEEDAELEGVDPIPFVSNYGCGLFYYDGFMQRWDSIYNNWDDDPWVWVCEFERIA